MIIFIIKEYNQHMIIFIIKEYNRVTEGAYCEINDEFISYLFFTYKITNKT